MEESASEGKAWYIPFTVMARIDYGRNTINAFYRRESLVHRHRGLCEMFYVILNLSTARAVRLHHASWMSALGVPSPRSCSASDIKMRYAFHVWRSRVPIGS
jgi:hypothetical protein